MCYLPGAGDRLVLAVRVMTHTVMHFKGAAIKASGVYPGIRFD